MSQVPYFSPVAQPVGQPTGAEIFGMENDADRVNFLRALGARNTEPPLPHSTHLRIKSSGRILPWEETLAEQRDLCECCDATGNTDPAAWQPFVDYSEYDPMERQIMALKAQEQAVVQAQARQITTVHQVSTVNPAQAQPIEYTQDAVPYDEIEKLLTRLG